MTGERYVLLGLAPPRAGWFDAVAQWVMSASIAAEFVKCVSVEEVRARLASGRQFSALLIDAAVPGFDRDLVDECSGRATPVIVVRAARSGPAVGADLGVAAGLPPDFDRDELLDVLASHCQPVGTAAALPPLLEDYPGPLWQAQMFAVCGPGGTGASTLAMALAQGLASDPRHGGRVLLADLARRADQAMLHDSPALGPGLQELVEAHRLSRPGPEEVAGMTFEVPRRGYRLLLGLRRPEGWSALRPRAIDAALAGLRRTFQVVVADITGDVEGEDQGGSLEVEERNHLSRSVALTATTVMAVGTPGLKGVHSLARLIGELVGAGVDPDRIVAVLNRSPRHPGARAESARALASILPAYGASLPLAAPVHVPERKLEDVMRDGAPIPEPLVAPIARLARVMAERMADWSPPNMEPARVIPGSLGSWSDPQPESGSL